MKKIVNNIFLFFIAIAITGIYTSCSKESEGTPTVSYVRVTNPEKSDSLLAGAYQSNTIAVIGENLQHAREVWIDDLQASLTPTYVTSTTIIFTMPSSAPKIVDNLLKIVFENGDTLKYPFKIIISAPSISSMLCEYVPEGGIATIYGNFFYEPLSVTFAGGVNGEVSSVSTDGTSIKVKVPVGAQPGSITVATNFGSSQSNFLFRDNRNIILSSDPFPANAWSGSSWVVSNPGTGDPIKISGNYIRVKGTISGWWTEIFNGIYTTAIPDEAILKPSLYYLKFEMNTVKPYNAQKIKFCMGALDGDHGDYVFSPPYDTKGEWQTVTIPFEEVAASYSNLAVSSTGYFTRAVFNGGDTYDCNMCFDNFRIVPKFK